MIIAVAKTVACIMYNNNNRHVSYSCLFYFQNISNTKERNVIKNLFER